MPPHPQDHPCAPPHAACSPAPPSPWPPSPAPRPPPHTPTNPPTASTCDQTISDVHVTDWTIRCVPAGDHLLPANADGATYPDRHLIVIQQGMTRDETAHVLGHELGHVDGDSLPADTQQRFATSLGQTSWTSGPYESQPNEVWAATYGRCAGWPDGHDVAYTRVSCETLAQFVHSAETGDATGGEGHER